MSKTKIEWTEQSWNPVVGCEVTSPGCKNCYAMAMAARIEAMQPDSHYQGTTKKVKGKAVWTGKVAQAPDHIWAAPLKRKKPTTYFVNSMGDLFHPNVEDAWIDRAFAIMALSPQHTFQILTKHPERMRDYLTRKSGGGKQDVRNHIAWVSVPNVMNKFYPNWKGQDVDHPLRAMAIQAGTIWPLPNVWLGVSVENQDQANARIPYLLETPAAVRFISAEPLLGPVELSQFDEISSLDWVICGGESGKGARPMHPKWARSLRDQCAAAGVDFFFKQWGAWAPASTWCLDEIIQPLEPDVDFSKVSGEVSQWLEMNAWGQDCWAFARTGKKAAGRTLDGRVHDAMPQRPGMGAAQ